MNTVKILISFRLRYRTVTVFGPSLQNVTVFCKKGHTVSTPLPTVTGNGQLRSGTVTVGNDE